MKTQLSLGPRPSPTPEKKNLDRENNIKVNETMFKCS